MPGARRMRRLNGGWLIPRGWAMRLLTILFLAVITAIAPGVSAQETLPVPAPVQTNSPNEDNSSRAPVVDRRPNPVLACLRIPAAIITEVASRDFVHTAPVDRVILGTHSRGTAVCSGHVTCHMRQQAHGAEVVCHIIGTVDSKTCGVNGPALIDSTASTSYRATKSIVFDGRKLVTQPAIVQANTHIQINGLGSSLPGLRGRAVRRVAERRAGDSLPEAEAITRNLTVAELQQQIDQEFAQRIASINRILEDRLPILSAFSESDYKLSISSQAEFIQLLFVRRDAISPDLQVPTTLPLSSKVVLWIPLPGPLSANQSAQDSDQQSPSIFDFQNSEQWLLENSKSFLPLWLTTAVTNVKDKLNERTERFDLLLHEKWIGVQFGRDAAK